MSELKQYLDDCKSAYYAGNPIISDSQYDHLESICSEDLSVGTHKGRIKHWHKMYSLKKIFRGDPIPIDNVYMITPKLDGASLSIRYLNGKLHSVVTRGNGEYGEDVSHLFLELGCILDNMGVPYEVPYQGAVQITGELVAPKSIENARNYAAGALNLKDSGEFWTRNLTFFAYDMQEFPMKTYLATLCYLRDMGFNTVYHLKEDHEFPIN